MEKDKNKENKKAENNTVRTKKVNMTKNRFEDVIEKMELETKRSNYKSISQQTEEKKIKMNSGSPVNNKKTNNEEVNEPKLEKIKEEIQKQKKISKENMEKIYLDVFENIMYAIFVLLYLILLCIGSKAIKKEIFITDLKVFSMFSIVFTICMIEYAYKKDSGRYAIHSIELLVISIVTLFTPYFYVVYNNKFIAILTSIALVFGIYFIGKSIIDYIKRKKHALENICDARKITK